MRTLFAALFIFLLFSANFGQQEKSGEKPPAPTFSATSIDGKIINTADLRGKIVVLNLWFINCPNCVEEIKLLNKIVDEYKGKNVVFLSLATNKKPDLEKFLKKNPFSYQIIPDATQIILSQFGEPDKNGQIYIPFPVHIVIDKEGKMLVKVFGIKGVEAVRNELKKQL